jgi:hypothetical protein
VVWSFVYLALCRVGCANSAGGLSFGMLRRIEPAKTPGVVVRRTRRVIGFVDIRMSGTAWARGCDEGRAP